MAKSKRSRRAQPEVTERQQQRAADGAAQTATALNGSLSAPAGRVEVAGQPRRKTVDFAEEYYYVYQEMRNILIVAVLMFLVMIGLAYFI
jgi:hypothetical protein